jgi:hypothetical protein
MPTLADKLPDYIDCVTIFAHADDDGQRYALELAHTIDRRGIEVFTDGVGP